MKHEKAKAKFLTPWTVLLVLVMAAGVVAAYIRYTRGLGAMTNLSDQYPWGIWIGIDVMSGVALAAGGFTTAAVVYLFGKDKYHGLARPAVLTGFLGYAFVGVGLLVDLAVPHHIWHPVIYHPEHSAMFEVAWCVMLYLTVLGLELLPAVFEGMSWPRATKVWRGFTPAFSVLALAWFVYIMSHSVVWAGVTLAVFGGLVFVLPKATRGVPIMLVIAGVVFSTMHQSSLGSLFLLMPDKLDALWWTPSLPINFFLSALAVGFAMVIFEATLSSKLFKRPPEMEALSGLGGILAVTIFFYAGFRLADLALRGNLGGVVESGHTTYFVLDLGLGALLPALMLSAPRIRKSLAGLFSAATLYVVFGVVFNRLCVSWLGMTMPGEGSYFPSVQEILVTAGIIATIVFLFAVMVKAFPVFAAHGEDHAPATEG